MHIPGDYAAAQKGQLFSALRQRFMAGGPLGAWGCKKVQGGATARTEISQTTHKNVPQARGITAVRGLGLFQNSVTVLMSDQLYIEGVVTLVLE